MELLTTHPVLVLPDWEQPFTLHTDASTLAAGSILTQQVEGRDAPVGYASKRFSRAEANLSPNDREVLAALYSGKYFDTYLRHRQFVLITDCAAILWLFTSQNLSPKMYRWALIFMAYDIVLKWRSGTENVGPDALSRLLRKGPRGPDIDIDVSVTDDRQGPQGPVLEGVQLKTLAPPLVDTAQEEEAASQPQVDTVRVEVPDMVVVSPRRRQAGRHLPQRLGPYGDRQRRDGEPLGSFRASADAGRTGVSRPPRHNSFRAGTDLPQPQETKSHRHRVWCRRSLGGGERYPERDLHHRS